MIQQILRATAAGARMSAKNRALAILAALACGGAFPAWAADAPAYRHGGGDMNPGGPEAERLENVALPPVIQDMRADLTRQAARVAQVFEGRRVSVAPFADARPGDRRVFGWNDQHRLPVTTREDLGGWVAAQVADALRTGGVEVLEEGGDLRLSGTLVEGMVQQGSKLIGSMRLELVVTDATGRELWRGREMGWAANRGRYSLSNFIETLDQSVLSLLEAWGKDEEFAEALARKSAGAGAAAKAEPRGEARRAASIQLTAPHADLARHAALAANALAGKRVSLSPLIDARRGDHAVIGRIPAQNRILTTRDDLGPWLTDQLAAVLRKAGVAVVPQGGDLNVWVAVAGAALDQDERCLGAVKLELVVTDASSREQWRGVKLGVAGIDSAEDVTEALSGAFLSALDDWWSDPAFLTAMGRPADPDAALRSRLPAPFSPGGLADVSARKLKNVELRFRPDDPVELVAQAASRALGGRKIVVAPFQEGRPPAERQLLGRVSGSDRDVTTRDDVARFCTGQLRQVLTHGGVEVAEEEGDLTISATVRRFLVEEQGTSVVSAYDGAVLLEVSVVDAARKPVWRGLALGAATQHGVKYQVENYHEAISDSLQRAFRWLFQELEPVTGARTN